MEKENERPQTDFKTRELRKLRFSSVLQIFAAIFFAGAAFVVGSKPKGLGNFCPQFLSHSPPQTLFSSFMSEKP